MPSQPPVVPRRLVIEYDCMSNSLNIKENGFSTLEALGVIEAAKAIIAANWLKPSYYEED